MTAAIIIENNFDIDKWYVIITYAILTQPTVTVLIMNISVLSFRLLLSVQKHARCRVDSSKRFITNDFTSNMTAFFELIFSFLCHPSLCITFLVFFPLPLLYLTLGHIIFSFFLFFPFVNLFFFSPSKTSHYCRLLSLADKMTAF